MLRFGRAVLLALSFLSLQLSLMGGGERCSAARVFTSGQAPLVGMDMAGMDMAEMDMAGMDMAGQPGDAAPTVPSSRHDEQRCDDDAANRGCDSMTVCVFAAIIAPCGLRDAERPPTVRPPVLAVRTPPTEGDAPDLPPPRLAS